MSTRGKNHRAGESLKRSALRSSVRGDRFSEQSLRRLIHQVKNGRRKPQQLLDQLRRLPFDVIGSARLDTHRHLRRGIPEVVLCAGKTPQQIVQIASRLIQTQGSVLLTRLDAEQFQQIHRQLPALRYEVLARVAYQRGASPRQVLKGLVLVVTGGTADVPVAEEAFVTLQVLGSRAVRLYDVGVAGLHRLLSEWPLLNKARVIIVIAGMEGALASVVAGLVRAPVVAVPTSIGYGANFGGIAPLLTMLNSCAPGIGVVNIDNGFGAAYLAHVINLPPR